MKIWITGIAGFLGSHLAERLDNDGHLVNGNDSLICGDLHNINLSISYTDCRDFQKMERDLFYKRPDVLIHCAATSHEGLSSFSPSYITKNIYEASVTTFSAAIAAGVKRIIFMSSMSRYGSQETPFNETMMPKPVDPYGIAKVAAEETLKVLAKTHGTEYIIAVPHNIIGPRQKYDDPFRNVASIMINRALQNKPIIIYGDGSQKRCFSPVKDCLHSLTKMIDAPLSGETINIGPDGGEITILELAHLIRDITGKHVDFEFFPGRPNEVKEAYCNSDKARRLLDFRPQQNLRACLSEMVDFIENNGVKPFNYFLPIEIEKGCPQTWAKRLI